VVACWQSDFCLPLKLHKIFSDWLSVEAIQTCASTQQQCDFRMTLLQKIKMEKIIAKKTKELYVIETLTKLQYCSEEANVFLL